MNLHRAGKISRGLLTGIVIAVAALGACFVPLRTCETCHGVTGTKPAQALGIDCKGCHGKGRQTLLEICVSAVRK